jgi:hypothetical protein
VFFNRKRPDTFETREELWMQTVRRSIQSGVSCYFTFKVLIWSLGDENVAVQICFTTSEKCFQTTIRANPEKFVKKEIIPWIRQNGQHV